MADIILHHYWLSPYAEKIRRILGFKNLAWNSVEIPLMAPKPDLVALTGGYRKTPVLQIGADIYCDTDCIARVLERLQPEPTLFAPGTEALSYMLGPWQSELFWSAVALAGTSGDVFPEGFVEDRDKMIPGGLDIEKMLIEIPATRDRLRSKLGILEGLLAGGSPYLFGDHASLADFSMFHPLFALKSLGSVAEVLTPYATVNAWLERIEAFGHGTFTQIDSSEAIEVARQSTSATATAADAGDPNERKPGDRVRIVHESFGNDPVEGEIVSSSAQQISIRREDERAGEVVVHFPREHYVILGS
jgi:glutathione S-transferase